MTTVFNEQSPLLDITTDNSDTNQKADEREGFKFLFMGGAQGLRYTRGHGAPGQLASRSDQISPHTTMTGVTKPLGYASRQQ